MKLRFLLSFLLSAAILLFNAQAFAQAQLEMTEVVFEEQEPGLEAYLTRVLLSKNHLRLDDGTDKGDFVLFDLSSGEVHSISHEEQSHLIIKPKKVADIEFKIQFTVQKKRLQDAPAIQGVTPVEHRFFANGKQCKQSINVTGFLARVVEVMIKYEQALVEHSKSTLPRIPSEVRSACYMANNFLHASDYLMAGFPLHVIDYEGRQKHLLSFKQVLKPDHILYIPDDYSVYRAN